MRAYLDYDPVGGRRRLLLYMSRQAYENVREIELMVPKWVSYRQQPKVPVLCLFWIVEFLEAFCISLLVMTSSKSRPMSERVLRSPV